MVWRKQRECRGRDGVDAVVVSTVEFRRGFCHAFVLEVFERTFGRFSWGGELRKIEPRHIGRELKRRELPEERCCRRLKDVLVVERDEDVAFKSTKGERDWDVRGEVDGAVYVSEGMRVKM